MFKKSSKRNLRARKTSEDDATEDNSQISGPVINVGMLKAERRKQKKAKKVAESQATSSKQSVLSFDQEDEDEGVFQLKKPSRSRRIAKHIKKIAQEEKERNQNEGSKYTAETLLELKALSVQPPSFDQSLPADETYGMQNNFSTTGMNQRGSFTDLKPGEIPDANRIHAARKQREMMRKYGSEYIPVENSSNARILRERQEDNEDSSDEDGPLVEMKGIIDDSMRVAGEIGCEGESALNRDYEFDEWEAEMIKKGISAQQFAARTECNENNPLPSSNDVTKNVSKPYNGTVSGSTGYSQKSWMYSSQSGAPVEAVKSVRSRVQDRLDNMQQTHSVRKMDWDRANDDIEESEKSADKMEDLTTMSSRYTFFQDTKAYVIDLLDCLSEKNAEIGSVENSIHKIWKERTDLLVSRRQQDVRDESEDITLSLSNSKITPNSIDHQKQTRIREREARRTRRRAKRQMSGTSRNHIDGLSSDDEETSMDKVKWSSERDRINSLTQNIFVDVVEEFSDVRAILSRFLDWKEKFPDSYSDAYIGLCLPKLIAPYIRLQILDWNPLMHETVAIEQMEWYRQLLRHGVKSDSEIDKSDSDNKLLAGLFDKVVMPKLTYIIGEVWDPMSSVQSHRLSMLLSRFLRTYPCMRADSKRCNDMLVTLCARIQQVIDGDAFIPIYPLTTLSNIMSGPGAFFERQTWTCIKLFKNIFLFDGILSKATLIELAFILLLNRYIMLALQISPATTLLVHKCSCIVDAIPRRWLEELDELSEHLEPLSRYLLHIAKLIHAEIGKCTPAEERKAKGCIGHIGKLLSRVGSYEMCQEIAELLGIDL